MVFTTDISSLGEPSSVTFNLVGTRLPNNHDLFFRSKQKELVEQYSAARIFLRETETDDWEHWFNPVEDDVTDKAIKLIFRSHFYETALFYYNAIVDMMDGIVARKTGTVSSFGSKLDTIADFVFAAVCLMKLIPVFGLETWMYIWIVVIAAIKGINLISGFVVQKKLVVVHSVMNKIAGALLFALPLTFRFIELRYSFVVVCSVALFAAIQEGHFIRCKMHPDLRS